MPDASLSAGAQRAGATGGALWRDGARRVGATAIGTACWGAVTGLALVKGGLSPIQAFGMVALVFSGTAQLAALPLLAAAAPLAAVWTAALLANLRFVVYSAVVAAEFRDRPIGQRLGLGWLTTDTGLAAYLAARGGAPPDEPPQARVARFVGANGLLYVCWTSGTIVGVLAASWLPDSPRLGFVGVLAVLALVGPMLRGRASLAIATLAGAVAVAGREWPAQLGTFAAIGAATAAALLVGARGEPAAPAQGGR